MNMIQVYYVELNDSTSSWSAAGQTQYSALRHTPFLADGRAVCKPRAPILASPSLEHGN